jgi:hypothetical protein
LVSSIGYPATVRHVTKDHVTITPSPDYSVTVFTISNGAVEAIVAADDGSETIRLLIAAPEPGRTMRIERDEPTGFVDIKYLDASDAKV